MVQPNQHFIPRRGRKKKKKDRSHAREPTGSTTGRTMSIRDSLFWHLHVQDSNVPNFRGVCLIVVVHFKGSHTQSCRPARPDVLYCSDTLRSSYRYRERISGRWLLGSAQLAPKESPLPSNTLLSSFQQAHIISKCFLFLEKENKKKKGSKLLHLPCVLGGDSRLPFRKYTPPLPYSPGAVVLSELMRQGGSQLPLPRGLSGHSSVANRGRLARGSALVISFTDLIRFARSLEASKLAVRSPARIQGLRPLRLPEVLLRDQRNLPDHGIAFANIVLKPLAPLAWLGLALLPRDHRQTTTRAFS